MKQIKRLQALETSYKAQGGVKYPSLAQWRRWRVGDVEGIPEWAIQEMQERREKAMVQIVSMFKDFENEIENVELW